MSQAIEAYYHTWESELTMLRTDDMLVNIDPNKVLTEPAAFWEQNPKSELIRKDYKKLKQEQGIDALVLTEGLVHWNKGNKALKTPVFLYEIQKIQPELKQLEFADQAQLNPYIKLLLQNEWQITTPDHPDEAWILQLVAHGIFTKYEHTTLIGNFHPQRYDLRREWEALKAQPTFSAALRQTIGDFDEEIPIENSIELQGQISPLDSDQKAAISLALSNSSVIYGPPGTGKSAVLSNVMAQIIFAQKKALVVSEKRSALEVLKHRLSEAGLGQFCLMAPSKNELAYFFQQLQQDFHNLLQARLPETKTIPLRESKAKAYWQQRKQLEQSAQTSLEELFICFGPRVNEPKATISANWIKWLHHRKNLAELPKELQQSSLYLSEYWAQNLPLELEKEWLEWRALFHLLHPTFRLDTTLDLEELAKKSLICHQFQSQVFLKYAPLLAFDQKKLGKMLNDYLLTVKQLDHLEHQLSPWIQIPSMDEWSVLKSLEAQKGFFSKRKWHNAAKKWLRLEQTPIAPFEKPIANYWKLKNQQHLSALKLTQLGIEHLEQEVPIVLQLIKQVNFEQYNWFCELEKEELQNFQTFQTQIYRLNSLHRKLFQSKTFQLSSLQTAISSNWDSLKSQLPALQKIPFVLWSNIGQQQACSNALKEEFWAYLRVEFPLVFQWDNPTFRAELSAALKLEENRQTQFIDLVKKQQIEQFTALENTLNQPVRKLNQAQKENRQALRKGKAILVREMAKTRQFIPLKNLLEGPAAPWLFAIYPIWLMNPTQVANSLPMECSIFDFGLFDEASQLPLSHAIGALQRVEKALIAGDPEQMRPSSYFSAQAEGVIDLLHQAAFHLPSCLLRYHYRSEHPSLIGFSNRHFYKNELKTWPSVHIDQPAIFRHYIQDAIYTDRQNEKEAEAIAKELQILLKQTDKIGIVAFSNQQLQCIFNYLTVAQQALLEDKISQRQAFFLALEQVQGEECDHLLISFGYGKNPEGEFSLRFGPMNQAQGGKRLNVLLTRARKSLHFYCSVQSTDFPAKRSESVELIYEWFKYLENPVEPTTTYDANERLASADDFDSFLHCYRVLKQRSVLPVRV